MAHVKLSYFLVTSELTEARKHVCIPRVSTAKHSIRYRRFCLSVHLSVCPSLCGIISTIMLFSPNGSPTTLVFGHGCYPSETSNFLQVPAFYPHSTLILPSFYPHSTLILPSFYPHSTLILPAFYPHSTLILPAFYPHSTRILPSFYPHSTLILPAFYPHSTLILEFGMIGKTTNTLEHRASRCCYTVR